MDDSYPIDSTDDYQSIICENISIINGLLKDYLSVIKKNILYEITNSGVYSDIDKNLMELYVSHLDSMFNPDNNLFLNPKAMKNFFDTKGKSVLDGMNNFTKDYFNLEISSVDNSYYILGENIANTKGCIVYENDLLQLIYYYPTGVTKKTYSIPILIVPPIINKYYVFDLSDNKSFVRYMLEQGYTVYMVSWVNPDSKISHYTIDDYLLKGILESIMFILTKHTISKINLVGYCISATMIAMLLSYIKKNSIDVVCSVTLIAMILDYKQQNIVKSLINDDVLDIVNSTYNINGVLSGYYMKQFFSFIRPKEMIWWNYNNNYII